ncbi:MAG TPA: carbohydrate-binding protein [Ktedonobacteraceae bacterium]
MFFVAIFSLPLLITHADSSVPAWNGNYVFYQLGTQVTYDGNTYQCIQSHTSEANWAPPNTPALWQLESGSSLNYSEVQISSDQSQGSATPEPGPIQETSQPQNGMIAVTATFYTDIGAMADGQQTHIGACAVYIPQFPLGTMINLYSPDNLSQPAYTCTAEDTGTHICQNNIDVALPGQVSEAIQLGVKPMQLQVVGFDSLIAQEAASNHYSSVGCELGPTH